MEKEIEKLKKRIEELEKRPYVMPVYPPIQQQTFVQAFNPFHPNFHTHNGSPCYNSPCVWC